MELVTGVSLIASFIGGMVALFAPCCITFLLPSYLGGIFKSKDKVVLMTLIFSLGIATVLVPTALGIRAVGQIFLQYHTQTYIFGGLFMVFLGLLNLNGKKMSLPMIHFNIDLGKNYTPWSMYVMGILSGITSSCCTPVLAGILTMSALSPSFFWAAMAGFSYVAGMVAPLVVFALVLERVHWLTVSSLRSRSVILGGKQVLITDLVAGLLYIGMGLLFIWLAKTGRIVMGMTVTLDQLLGSTMMDVVRLLKRIPYAEYLFGIISIACIIVLVTRLRRK